MRIETVLLENYRAHENLLVGFQSGFNLVVGVNGSGKTSLLKGVCEALSGFTNDVPNIHGYRTLAEQDIAFLRMESVNGRLRFEPQFPIEVHAAGSAFGLSCDWRVWKSSSLEHYRADGIFPGRLTGMAPDEPAIGPFAKQTVAWPLVAFYRASRQWNGAKPSEMQAATEKISRTSAYASWWDASLDSSAFQGWVISKCLERFQTSSETGIPFDDIHDDELALVSAALAEAVDGFRGMKYDLKQKSLLIDWQASAMEMRSSIGFENLSDGQRAVICLVADIARRMCILNPILGQDVIAKTPGVVLIDELDMHLHPRWQRILTTGLKRAFPSVQFIAASHSPQVIGELHPDEIILLRKGETSHPQVSYGLTSSQILEEIMGAEARSVEVEERLERLFEALERNEFEFAREIIEGLKNDVPGIPELAGAEALLRRKQVLGR